MMQKIHVFVYILFAVSGPPVVVNGTKWYKRKKDLKDAMVYL